MAETERREFAFRVLRYAPNILRDEWVNIGVILEQFSTGRRQARLVEESAEFARIRRVQPDADEAVLRGLPGEMEKWLSDSGGGSAANLAKLDDTLSNVLQLSPQRALLGDDFDAELDRLYRDYVAPAPRRGRGAAILESTRAWIRTRMNDVFRRHRILGKLEKGIAVEQFTQPGDPLHLDYGYRVNGTRGFMHAISLGRDPGQAKVLAFTAEAIRRQIASTEFVGVTEEAPQASNPRHQFVARLLAEQSIQIVALPQIEAFAERLRPRLN
jgi:Protein of unknown function (DUF3037)